MTLVSAVQVFQKIEDEVDAEQVESFSTDFNTSMADPHWVKSWRCGDDHDPYWRFSCSGDHNKATTGRIAELLALGGWKIRECAKGNDRGRYTCYTIGKA